MYPQDLLTRAIVGIILHSPFIPDFPPIIPPHSFGLKAMPQPTVGIPSDERSNPFSVMKFHRVHSQSVVL